MKSPTRNDSANPGHLDPTRRLRRADVAWTFDRLSDRDWQIIEAVNRLRLITGQPLERLYFHDLTGHAREVVRGRVLRRLVRWRVLAVSARRIGGAARGSAGAAFALDSVGAHILAARQAAQATRQRVRHPGLPTERAVRHTLAVSELYVALVEYARRHGAVVATFAAEPASWWPDGRGGSVKPDGYTLLAFGSVREHWWLEVDLATESVPTIKRKLSVYLDFVQRGQLGPAAVVPRVLVVTLTPERRDTIRDVIARLPEPAAALCRVVTLADAAAAMLRSLHS